MSLEMVYVDYRLAEGQAERLCERSPDKQGAEEPRAAGERDGVNVILVYAGFLDGLAYHGDDIEFVGPGGKFRDYASEVFMDLLAGYYV